MKDPQTFKKQKIPVLSKLFPRLVKEKKKPPKFLLSQYNLDIKRQKKTIKIKKCECSFTQNTDKCMLKY